MIEFVFDWAIRGIEAGIRVANNISDSKKYVEEPTNGTWKCYRCGRQISRSGLCDRCYTPSQIQEHFTCSGCGTERRRHMWGKNCPVCDRKKATSDPRERKEKLSNQPRKRSSNTDRGRFFTCAGCGFQRLSSERSRPCPTCKNGERSPSWSREASNGKTSKSSSDSQARFAEKKIGTAKEKYIPENKSKKSVEIELSDRELNLFQRGLYIDPQNYGFVENVNECSSPAEFKVQVKFNGAIGSIGSEILNLCGNHIAESENYLWRTSLIALNVMSRLEVEHLAKEWSRQVIELGFVPSSFYFDPVDVEGERFVFQDIEKRYQTKDAKKAFEVVRDSTWDSQGNLRCRHRQLRRVVNHSFESLITEFHRDGWLWMNGKKDRLDAKSVIDVKGFSVSEPSKEFIETLRSRT